MKGSSENSPDGAEGGGMDVGGGIPGGGIPGGGTEKSMFSMTFLENALLSLVMTEMVDFSGSDVALGG